MTWELEPGQRHKNKACITEEHDPEKAAWASQHTLQLRKD